MVAKKPNPFVKKKPDTEDNSPSHDANEKKKPGFGSPKPAPKPVPKKKGK